MKEDLFVLASRCGRGQGHGVITCLGRDDKEPLMGSALT
jgi:hypothetical protein